MFTKTALIAALTLGTIVAASAEEFDPNLQNRYPQASVTQTFQTRNVAAHYGAPSALIHNESYVDRTSQSTGDAR